MFVVTTSVVTTKGGERLKSLLRTPEGRTEVVTKNRKITPEGVTTNGGVRGGICGLSCDRTDKVGENRYNQDHWPLNVR